VLSRNWKDWYVILFGREVSIHVVGTLFADQKKRGAWD
jgi:hypothetical protein